MKIKLSKLLIVLIVINLLQPFNAAASSGAELYNCGSAVPLSGEITQYNGSHYILLADVPLINLEADDNVIYDYSYSTELVMHHGSSIIEVNGKAMLYSNASVVLGGDTYISLDLLAMLFSKLYETTGNHIELWISSERYASDFIRGVLSLPDGEYAPEGGICAEVFVTAPNGSIGAGGSHGSNVGSGHITGPAVAASTSIGSAGYKGKQKPVYDDLYKTSDIYPDYDKLVSKNVVIPEGYNSAEFYLSAPGGDFTDSRIGYYAEIDGSITYDTVKFNKRTEVYSLKISVDTTYISGTVTLPEPVSADTEYTVVALGDCGYSCSGIVKSGEAGAEFSLAVSRNDTYSLLVLFADGEYMRTTLGEDVVVGKAPVNGVNFDVSKAVEYTARITLPDGYSAQEDISLEVYLQSAESPYYYLDTVSATIPKGERSVSVALHDDMAAKNVICYYSLSEEYKGLYSFGHYSSDGTSFDIDNAELIDTSCISIELPLLKSKDITANIVLPDEEFAQGNVYVTVSPRVAAYPYDAVELMSSQTSAAGGASSGGGGNSGAGFGGGSISGVIVARPAEPTIPEGEYFGTKIFSVPDENGYRYALDIKVSDSADAYYKSVYYNAEKTTAVRNNASLIDNKTDSVTIELIRQYSVTGVVDAIGYDVGYNRISAIYQSSDIRDDVYMSDFSVYTSIYGNGAYELFVPDEFDNYILKLQSTRDGDSIFYSSCGVGESIEESELLTINDSLSDVDFVYGGYNPPNPLVLSAARESADVWEVSLETAGDLDVENVTVYFALYDENLRLVYLASSDGELTVNPGRYTRTLIDVPDDIIYSAEQCRVFAWSGMKPVSEVHEVEFAGTVSGINEQNSALLYTKEGSSYVYNEGQPYEMDMQASSVGGVLYLPLRAMAECLDWTAEWDNATKTATVTYNGNRLEVVVGSCDATVNGEAVTVGTPPVLILNDRCVMAVGTAAGLMGYITESDADLGTLAVYDRINHLVYRACVDGLVTVGFESSDADDRITHKQLSSIIVNMYEKVSGEIEISPDNPYLDIYGDETLKAYEIGIMNVSADGTVRLYAKMTNAEMITLYSRAIKSLNAELPTDYSATTEYADFPKDGNHWALDSVYGMKAAGILKYVYEDEFMSDDYADIRHAIAFGANCYKWLRE